MKKIFYLAAALTVLAGAASCENNIETTQSQPSGEYRQVTITAGAVVSKTSVNNGALTWSANDKLYIAPQDGSVDAAALNITDGVGKATATFSGSIDKTIKDDTSLYGWCGGSWTYNSGSFSIDMPATQTYVENGLAENAYPSIGTGTIKNGITLTNPMGVLKVSLFGAMAGDKVKSITVTSAANNLAGSFSIDKSTYAVSGGSSKTVTLNVYPYVALSLTDTVKFYIVLPPAKYSANDLTVKVTLSDDSFFYYTSGSFNLSAGDAAKRTITDHTGRRGTLNGQEYVLIRAKYDGTNYSYLKWATQNLAVTESGKAKWNGTNYQIGDYFQCAASYDGYNITTPSDQKPANLVIYTSFTHEKAGGASNSFTFKTGKSFIESHTPYYNSSTSSYIKYNTTDNKTALDKSDDVANLVLGDPWRMPTGGETGEYQAMVNATRVTVDDFGDYLTKRSESLASDKSNALLFFPRSGYGNKSAIYYPTGPSYYWSNIINLGNTPSTSGGYNGGNGTWTAGNRNAGLPVRPVSE